MDNLMNQSDEYNALREAMNNEDDLMAKVEEIMESTSDKEEAERIIREKYLPLIERAVKRTKETLKELREVEKRELKTIEEEMDDIIEGEGGEED
jgi:ElaB/YqjD/DUF883 family membrane-anchored ribosome-binding protein